MYKSVFTKCSIFKGVIGCKIHFYMLFELKCVLAVCVHNHPTMIINIHQVFVFLNQINHNSFFKSSVSQMPVCVTSHRPRPSHDCWLTLAFYWLCSVIFLGKKNKHLFGGVFPTHRLYLGGPPKYIWWHIFVFITILILLQFLSARENETIHNRLTIGKSPLALHISFGSFCVLENCRHSHRQPPVFPIRSLWRAASTALCHQLPRDECDFSTIFRNFQTLLVDFFHNKYTLTALAKKP